MLLNKINILENLILEQNKVAYHTDDNRYPTHPVSVRYHYDHFNHIDTIKTNIANNEELIRVTSILSKYGNPYLVGGGVRDSLLGLKPKDFDIEVYGITKEKLSDIVLSELGGKGEQVGSQFAVFKVGEFDISLPRKESKIGVKHTDFEVTEDPSMNPEDAARRRDFTINSFMFSTKSNQLFDFFDGLDDLKNKIIRHIDKNTFVEDPLRVYRAAQFAGRFGFVIAPETIELASSMDLSSLPIERVNEEFNKLLLKSPKPSIGLIALDDMKVLERYFPEISVLKETSQRSDYHAEGSVWTHTKLVIDKAAEIIKKFPDEKDKRIIMLASLCHDFGKATTTKIDENGLITQHGHEEAGIEPTKKFLSKLTNETDIVSDVLFLVENHLIPLSFHRENAGDVAFKRLINKYGIRKLNLLAAVSEADSTGRLHKNEDGTIISPTNQEVEWFRNRIQDVVSKTGVTAEGKIIPLITGTDLLNLGLKTGPQIGKILQDIKEQQESGILSDKESALAYIKDRYIQKSIDIEEDEGFKHKHDSFPEHPIGVKYHVDYFRDIQEQPQDNKTGTEEQDSGHFGVHEPGFYRGTPNEEIQKRIKAIDEKGIVLNTENRNEITTYLDKLVGRKPAIYSIPLSFWNDKIGDKIDSDDLSKLVFIYYDNDIDNNSDVRDMNYVSDASKYRRNPLELSQAKFSYELTKRKINEYKQDDMVTPEVLTYSSIPRQNLILGKDIANIIPKINSVYYSFPDILSYLNSKFMNKQDSNIKFGIYFPDIELYFLDLLNKPHEEKIENARPGLIARKVPIHLPEKTIMGIRWVKPEEGQKVTIGGVNIPGNLTDVWISPDKSRPLQAFGFDSKGRKQYVYSKKFSEKNAAKKFNRLKAFSKSYTAIVNRLIKNISKAEEAQILYIISKTGFRIGSEQDTGGDVETYGISTLEGQHTKVDGSKTTFSFIGKKGVLNEKTIDDPIIADIISKKKTKDGKKIFSSTDSQVRVYLKNISGKPFLVKDFRTYLGTSTAFEVIKKMPIPTTPGEWERGRKAVAIKVSEVLGNTPQVALSAYIVPEVFSEWISNLEQKGIQVKKQENSFLDFIDSVHYYDEDSTDYEMDDYEEDYDDEDILSDEKIEADSGFRHTHENHPQNHPDGNIIFPLHPIRVKDHKKHFRQEQSNQLDQSLKEFERKQKLRYDIYGRQKIPINWLSNKVIDYIGQNTDLAESDKIIIKEKIFDISQYDYVRYSPKSEYDDILGKYNRVLYSSIVFNGESYDIYLVDDESIFIRKVNNNIRPQDSPIHSLGIPSDEDYLLDKKFTEERYDKDNYATIPELKRRREILKSKIRDFDRENFEKHGYDTVLGFVPSDHLHKFTGVILNPNDYKELEVGVYKGEVRKARYIGFFHPINNAIELYGEADYYSFVHEIGHAIHLSTISRALGMELMVENRILFEEASDTNSGFPSNYSKTNEKEFFAECYASYLTEKNSFKERNPKAFLFMERVFERMKGIDDNYLNFGIKKSEDKETEESIGDPKGVGRFEEGLPNLENNEKIEKQFTPKNFNPIRTLTSAFKHETSGKLAQHTHENHPQNHPDGNIIFPLHSVSVEDHKKYFQNKERASINDRGDLFKPNEFEIGRRRTLLKQLISDDVSVDLFNKNHLNEIFVKGPPASHLLKVSKINIIDSDYLEDETDLPEDIQGFGNSIAKFYITTGKIELSKTAKMTHLIHEIGHAVLESPVGRKLSTEMMNELSNHYDNAKKTNSGFPTDYSDTNVYEFFAECYLSFVTQNKHFLKRNKEMYNYLQRVFDYFKDSDDVFLSTGINKSDDVRKEPERMGEFNPNLPDLVGSNNIEAQQVQEVPVVSRPGLHKKKVAVERNGKTFMEYRWVKDREDEVTDDNKTKQEVFPNKKATVPSYLSHNTNIFNEKIISFSNNDWTLDTIRDMFSSNIDGISIDITKVKNYLDTELELDFNISDNNGNVIGEMSRLFSREIDDDGIERITVDHKNFRLNTSIQGKGIASRLLESIEDKYKENGVHSIQLEANLEVGAYAWALQGYDFSSELQLKAIRSRFSNMLKKNLSEGRLNEIQFKRLSDEMNGFYHTWEFASWNPSKSPWGSHIGKRVMLGAAWHGVKVLNENSQGYKIGKAYRKNKTYVAGDNNASK